MLLAPFRGMVYDAALDRATVTCPPYDVIDRPAFYRDRSLYNLAHLLLPENGSQEKAAHTLESWIAAGVLREEPGDQFYLHHMAYEEVGGVTRKAHGVIGALALHDHRVVGHEETIPSTRQDRLDLLRATETNLDLIIALSSSLDLSELLEPTSPPRMTFTADRVTHQIFDITTPEQMAAISATIDAGAIAIADGHHRYSVATQYAQARRGIEGPGPWDRIMAFVAPAAGSGLSVGAIHRLLPQIDPDWADVDVEFERTAAPPMPPSEPGEIVLVLGSAHGGGATRLVPRPQKLADLPPPWQVASSAVARERLWPALLVSESDARYHASPDLLLSELDHYRYGGVALLSPVPEEAIAAAALEGIRFPQKTTYFAPKPCAGVVLRRFTS